ncbi:MAG TPA: M20/M25/M40 family metallo-hydrolase [Thermomicrobiales bacterium]|nr:M20/M25/M40 family metallo-hydrolase [Thermomicrobiales bacterium]
MATTNHHTASDAFAGQLQAEAVRHLQALLKLDTTSPPGHERLAADYIATQLDAEGIPYEIVESAPTRANLVARLKADAPSAPPLLLMGHTDVVSVERDKWERDPFGGELDADGFVWGRGALDMKSMVAGELTIFLELKRQGIPLDRDVIFAAFADEEVSGELGAGWVYQHRNDLIGDAEYALNEGGGYPVTVGGVTFLGLGSGEKGQSIVRITFRGKPGHASTPLPDTAVAKLGRALVLLDAWEPEFTITTPVRRTLEGLAAIQTGEVKAHLEALLAKDAPAWDDLAAVLTSEREQRSFWAVTHHTAVPTLIGAGERINVIPSEVTVDVDCRILPGITPEGWRDLVQEVVGDLGEVELLTRNEGVAFDPASPFADAIQATVDGLLPGTAVIPALIGGRTDAAHLKSIKTYGFWPVQPGERVKDYMGLAHGHNERVHVDDVGFGTRFGWNLVTSFAAKG